MTEGRLGLGNSPCADDVTGEDGAETDPAEHAGEDVRGGTQGTQWGGPSWGDEQDELPPSVEAAGRRWKAAHDAAVMDVLLERATALGQPVGSHGIAVPRPGPMIPGGAASGALGNGWEVSVRLLCRGYLSSAASLGTGPGESESKSARAAAVAVREDPSPASVVPGLGAWPAIDRSMGWMLGGTDTTAALALEAETRKASVAAAGKGDASGSSHDGAAAGPGQVLGGSIGAALRRADSRVRGLELGLPEDGPMSARTAAEMSIG